MSSLQQAVKDINFFFFFSICNCVVKLEQYIIFVYYRGEMFEHACSLLEMTSCDKLTLSEVAMGM